MIDMLVLRCPFADVQGFNLRDLRLPLMGEIASDGTVYGLRHPYEKLPSSYAPLVFKVFDHPIHKDELPYIELRASPAKVMQGHNIFGTDDLGKCATALIEAFFAAYPHVFELLSHDWWEVAQVDVTYFSRARNEKDAEQFIQSLQQVSKGQVKARHGYSTTAYFGKKNSRIRKIKVYAKLQEVMAYLKEQEKRGDPNKLVQYYTPELLEFARGMVRWESSLKSRWFSRRKLPTKLIDLCRVWDAQAYWQDCMSDIFAALEGRDMRLVKDDEVLNRLKAEFSSVDAKGVVRYRAALSAYNTYRAIRTDGYVEVSKVMARNTFWRHVSMLEKIGFSHAALQNMGSLGMGGEVVPLVRYIAVDFGAQFPDWHKQAA